MSAMQPPDAVILDASVTAAWLLPDESGPAAERAYVRLRTQALQAHAPRLWLWECANVLANAVKRQRLAPADLAPAWALLDAVRTRVELIELDPGQVRAALQLGVDEALSAYDAAYLWLALSLRLPLLTHDERLAAAAERRQVATYRFETLG
jgi:predicted nucleic acid-binding protein